MFGSLLKFFLVASLWLSVFLFASCEKDTDGPLDVMSENFSYDGEGFFSSAELDSGKTIHLSKDTLFLGMGKMWTFSNCALESIKITYSKEDSILWLMPRLNIHATAEDCAAPYYRPDTVLRVTLSKEQMQGIGMIKVKNDADSVLDSILLRRGSFSKDTFYVYLDSSFADAHAYPLRTKDKKKGKEIPSVIRVLDSLTPRVFYWRTMKSVCTHRVDMCKKTIADTVYPTSWYINDTNLVPVHYACADSDSVYCINSKWENDSTELGKVQERPDTIWHYSTYYTEKIPKCGTFNQFSVSNYTIGDRVRFIRELMTPDKDESFCGPASQEEWMVYNMSKNQMVLDTGSVAILDSLKKIWKKATVAPDTLKVDTSKAK
ncbi:MAG: hypothetical protein IKO21_07885 [Fibrobacter sp.]|nr:hypothetical protein [Fibrobacter sp.]